MRQGGHREDGIKNFSGQLLSGGRLYRGTEVPSLIFPSSPWKKALSGFHLPWPSPGTCRGLRPINGTWRMKAPRLLLLGWQTVLSHIEEMQEGPNFSCLDPHSFWLLLTNHPPCQEPLGNVYWSWSRQRNALFLQSWGHIYRTGLRLVAEIYLLNPEEIFC